MFEDSEVEKKRNNAENRVIMLIIIEIYKIKRRIPQYYDDIAKFLVISRPIVEVVLMNCGNWKDQIKPRAG
ncbi:MAG: hypothetical protein ACTSRP_17040 [Candidatus Helarchaeota archaeon]